MYLIYIVLSHVDCVSDLNNIMQLPRNLEGDSVNGFDRSDNVYRCWGLYSVILLYKHIVV